MRKYNLLLIICCFLFCANTFAQGNDDEFEFEFELIYYTDDSGSDDDSDDSDDDSSYSSDDDSDARDHDSGDSDDDGGYSSDDSGYSSGNNGYGTGNTTVFRADITLTNTGSSSITNNILFRADVSTTTPETLPTEYDAERLVIFGTPLEVNDTKTFSLFIPPSSLQLGAKNIVTVWPVAEGEENFPGERPSTTPHFIYQVIFVPQEQLNRKKADISNISVSKFKVYPNPTRETLQIEIPDHNTTEEITIYKTTGQVVKTFTTTNSDMITLDLKGLIPDIYFVVIKNEESQIIHYSKIIIHK